MKTLISLTLSWVLSASLVCAESMTERNAGKVDKIIQQAIEAHGGPDGIDAMQTLYIEQQSINYAVGQSRHTEAPWDQNESSGYDAIDLANNTYVSYNAFNSGSFESLNRTIINGEDSFQTDLRAGTVSRIAEPDLATTSGPFIRVTPALLVRTLRDRAGNAHYLGHVRDGDMSLDVVAFSMTVGPAITLYFDSKDHLLRRSERLLPGFGLVRYEFIDYERANGIAFNRTFRFYVGGELNVERRLSDVRVNSPLSELLVIDQGLQSLPATVPDALARQEIADGVWLIGGNGTYAMFVDMGEYVFAAGGTAGIDDRIRLLREVVGDKPLRYGMLTHHHSDHVLGVAAYETEGATVIAATAHEQVARASATDGGRLDVRTVDDKLTLESGRRVIEVINLGPTAHTEHLLVAYLPVEGILFEADHFSMPRVGPAPPAQKSTRSFAAALQQRDLNIRRILSAHSPRAASMDDLRAALSAERYQASR